MLTEPISLNLEAAFAAAAREIEAMLDRLLPSPAGPETRLMDAMRYAVLSGGKRIRPFLTLQAAQLFGVTRQSALRTAAAIECIHCYSLAHDDLPAMDDDDLRRGKPTLHKAFDEATAILAGDALLTFAFEVAADYETHPDPRVRVELVSLLAQASGCHGMVGGQIADLSAAGMAQELSAVMRMQKLKTGAMISCATELGAVLGKADPDARLALKAFAHDLGLAFQITDDLLDVVGRVEDTGKRVRKDADKGKATFVSIMGVERAREQARLLAGQAVDHLANFDERAQFLRLLPHYVVERRR